MGKIRRVFEKNVTMVVQYRVSGLMVYRKTQYTDPYHAVYSTIEGILETAGTPTEIRVFKGNLVSKETQVAHIRDIARLLEG